MIGYYSSPLVLRAYGKFENVSSEVDEIIRKMIQFKKNIRRRRQDNMEEINSIC